MARPALFNLPVHPASPAPGHAASPLPKRRRALTAGTGGLILCLLWLLLSPGGTLRAQDTESDNPTGPSGDFNGDVTTAGRYDPFTGNVKRQVTDLTVPGSNGAYPLVFARTYNSNLYAVDSSSMCFGDGGNWRHNYQWTLYVAASNSINGTITAYGVAYPDGSGVTFRPGRNSAPASEYGTFWRGPSGTPDRLEVQSASTVILHTADGGLVNFGSNGHASTLVDPNGAVTALSYVPNNPDYLQQVTEPGGRTLTLSYATATYKGRDLNGAVIHRTWTLLSQVQASTGHTVTYTDTPEGSQYYGQTGGTTPYYDLTGVSYDQEPVTSAVDGSVVSGGGNVHASYSYNTAATPPSLATATDPHYAGAMVNIRYAFGTNTIEEQNQGSSEMVSHLALGSVAANGARSASTETRGDKSSGTGNSAGSGANLTRAFNFGQANPAIPGDSTPSVKASLLTSTSDFEGYTSLKYYYDVNDKDTNGKSFLKSSIDAKNVQTNYTHEPLTGKVTSTQFADGRTRTAIWRAADDTSPGLPYYLYQTTDERGQSTTYHHYSNTGLTYQVDYPDGSHEYYGYQGFTGSGGGAFYKVSVYTNRLGGQITYGYDEPNHGGSGHTGLLTSVTRKYAGGPANGEPTNFYYDALDRVVQTVDPRGVSDTYAYNSRHQVVQVTHAADGSSASSGYDSFGNQVCAQDESGHKTSTVYDEYRRAVSVTTTVNAPAAGGGAPIASRTQSFDYGQRDLNRNVVSDALSHTDGLWGLSYAPSTRAVVRIFSGNHWLTDEHDGMTASNGSAAPQPGAGYVHLTSSYYANGLLHTATDAQGFSTTYGYDNCNRLTQVTDPLGHQTTRTFYANHEPCTGGQQPDCGGLLKSVTAPGPDAANFPTVTTVFTLYNKMGQVRSTQDPYSHTFNSNYDAGGNLASQSDGVCTTGYVYDQLGRKSQLTYPDQTTERWTYDASGNVSAYWNRAGAECTYNYTDGRNRCTSYTWSDGTSGVTYTYYANGQPREISNGSADLQFTYDGSGALLSEYERFVNQSSGLTTRYTHDADGNVDSITYPGLGAVPHFTYDAQNRPLGMDTGGVQYSLYGYAGDRLSARYLLNSLYTTYDYQNDGRIMDVWHRNGGTGHNVRRHAYGHAPDGRVSWVDREPDQGYSGGSSGSALENGRGDVFYYWPDGSLGIAARDVAATGGWPGVFSATADSRVTEGNVNYAGGSTATALNNYGGYDAAGNRSGNVTQMNQPTLYYQDNGAGEDQYAGSSYNANGNCTNAATGWTYTYDAENKLTGGTGPSGQTLALYYDGLGRVVGQAAGGVSTLFYYAGAQRIEEHDGANNAFRYAYFFDAPGSDQILFRQGGNWGRLWYQYDALGNTTHLSGETYDANSKVNGGYVVEQYLYDAYGTPTVYDAAGNVRAGGSAYDNRYLFKGAGAYEWLPGPSLYYARARFYLPQHGRWLQPDPIGQAGGLNVYSYCGNDPVNMVDPSGLLTLQEIAQKISNGWQAAIDDIATPIANYFYGDPTQERVVVTAKDPNQPITVQAHEAPADDPDDPFHLMAVNKATGGTGIGLGEYNPDHEKMSAVKARARQGAISGVSGGAQALMLPLGPLEGGGEKMVEAGAGKVAEEVTAEAAGQGAANAVTQGVVNPKIYAQLEKQLASAGPESIQKALASATQTLADHQLKLQNILETGGYPSQVQRTIVNVQNQIATLQQFISDNGL